MPSFFASFRRPIGSKDPSRDIGSTSDASGRSPYPPYRTSTSASTTRTNSLEEQSSTEKACVDARSSRPSTATSARAQKEKSHTLDSQSKPSQQSRHRHGLGNSRRALSQPVVSFSTPSIPRPQNYRKHTAFARRNEPGDPAPTHDGPCAQVLKTILHVLRTILVQPISVAVQQISRVCFGGRVTTRRRPAWVARR